MPPAFRGRMVHARFRQIEFLGQSDVRRRCQATGFVEAARRSLCAHAGIQRTVATEYAFAHCDPTIGAWVAPFIMAPINTKNVHRTNFLISSDLSQTIAKLVSRMCVAAPTSRLNSGGFGLHNEDENRQNNHDEAKGTLLPVPS
jgi:hypothetical protein